MSVANTGASVMASFSNQCFPVRSLTRGYKKDDEGGAWLVAYRAEQRRRFKAVLCGAGPEQTTKHISRQKTRSVDANTDVTELDKPRKLDGFYLMKEFHVEDPADLCYIRISGRELREASETDFLMFDNVVHVDAGDNNLPFTAFRMFQALRELELPLNNISGSITVDPSRDFQHLETLDLSYNRLTGEDILALGLLQNLKTLHLTGNEIKNLPVEMARTYRTITGITASGTVESRERRVRFPCLENLYLDQNELTDLSTFASLAGLKRLRYLNLEHNEISSVPHLRLLGARVRQEDGSKAPEATKQAEEHPTQPERQVKDLSTSQGDVDQHGAEEKETGTTLADEVEEILNKRLPDVDESYTEHLDKPDLRPRSSTLTEDPALLDEKYDPPLPFSSLLHLNLANNVIFEEEGLLALASWPVLRELVIWGNPLTTAFKGDPPILSYHLGRLRGVRIFRQKPTTRPKPVVNLADNTTRKVSDALPPVPRKRDQFMLEAPPKQESIAYVGPHAQPLPPIASAPPRRWQREAVCTPRQLATAPANADTSWREGSPAQHHPHDKRYPSLSPCRMTVGSVQTEAEMTRPETVGMDETSRQPQAEKSGGRSEDGFFMTQIDDLENGEQTSKEGRAQKRSEPEAKKKKEEDRPFSVQTKYKGFEDLLDIDESGQDSTIPEDIQGSLRALHYALRHPLVFTEEPHGFTYREQQTRRTRDPFETSAQKSRQSKVEEMGDILDKMRVKSKTTEHNLETVLKDYKKDPTFRKDYQEAKKLLNEVQTKYNEVRVSSLRPAAQAFALFGDNTPEDSPKESTDGTCKTSPKRKISDRTLITKESKQDVVMDLKKFKEKLDSRI